MWPAGGFHRSLVDPCKKHQRQQCSPNLMYMGMWGYSGGGGGGGGENQWGRLSHVHTWVYLVPEDLKWNDPFNNE